MPSLLSDAAGSPVFWIALVVILLVAVGGYILLQRRVEFFPPPVPDNSKVVQDWIPTGRIDFAGPSLDPSAADTPATFYLQAEDVRLLISMSGIERREIRWRRATFNEAKRIVSVFHRQLPKSSFRALEKEQIHEMIPLAETPVEKDLSSEAALEREPPPHADATVPAESEPTDGAGADKSEENDAKEKQ